MSNLTFSEGNNIGSIARIELAPAWAFVSLSPVVTFRDGYSWDPALILPESGQLTDEALETDAGIQYTYNLVFAFNKKNAELLAGLRPYMGTVAIAKVTDANGFVQIIGNQQTPITFKQNADTGKKNIDMNNVMFTGVCVADREALTVT